MVRKCFLRPSDKDTTLTSDKKADATFIDVNAITTNMTEVLKYWFQTSKRMYSKSGIQGVYIVLCATGLSEEQIAGEH